MQRELEHFETCSKSPDPELSIYFTRQANNTRTAIEELEGLIRAQEEAE